MATYLVAGIEKSEFTLSKTECWRNLEPNLGVETDGLSLSF